MAKSITIDSLADEINGILEQYGDEISENMDRITKEVGAMGVKALKNESANKFGTVPGQKRKYAKSWASKVETGRLYTTVTIYNKKPGLPHLLEHGHALRGGGRVAGREHIAGVEKELIKEFENAVRRDL